MGKIKTCGGCGVPCLIGKEQSWLDSGVIRQNKTQDMRMIFYESENLSSLFSNIEEIIGLPIEHIIIESKRRDVKEYTEKAVKPLLRKIVRHVGFGVVARQLSNLGLAYGFGAIQLGESRRKSNDEDFQSMIITNPHSIAFFTGEVLGAWEAIDGRDSFATFGKVGENTYKVTCHIGGHPLELSERLGHQHYRFKPGTLHFERCSVCGVPLDVARYRWNLEDGTIRHPVTGIRMTVISPTGIDAIFSDLESELGEAIPETVVEAQRRFIREAMQSEDWQKDEAKLRSMLALRGLGQLSAMEFDDRRLSITIQNSCMPLLMVGTMQGIFELASGVEGSTYSWERTDDGDLSITIKK